MKDLEKMLVKDLKSELANRNLPTNGIKNELLKRLKDALEKEASGVDSQNDSSTSNPNEPQEKNTQEEALPQNNNNNNNNNEDNNNDNDENIEQQESRPATKKFKEEQEESVHNNPNDTTFQEQDTHEQDQAASDITPTEPSIHITGIKRPVKLPELKKLLEDFGDIVQWEIDKNRSQCYAIYKEVSVAVNAKNTLDGITWPPENNTRISVRFCPKKEALEFFDLISEKPQEAPVRPVIDIDTLFCKTQTKPSLYYRPWTEQEIASRSAARTK